ncbi:PPOX class F420-dependent oxidoreductase [Streptomyces sp. NPDC001812]|uniref:PPOX class F420-dependent oxidoreductase n=1 Tax=Streptomyces cathayae TaxID=3031124 RepID=A0ABY8K273_9ACTN|nr:PPOX class F420-dependent oxidoreductase [Streptomyces sp. HUAS 5]WGD41001.1 PPOX class F420-dependent oxidoreductase [Streptomyces sp. HUAS 5]
MTGVPLTERVRALLDAPVFAVVATVGPDGTPHQSVVWVTHDGSHLLFGIERGSRKERELTRSGRVGVLLHPPEAPYTYVSLWGAAELEPHERHPGLMDAISRKYTGLPHAEFLGGNVPAEEDLVFVRLVPERVLDVG